VRGSDVDDDLDSIVTAARRDAKHVATQIRTGGHNALRAVELMDAYRLAIAEAMEAEAVKLEQTDEYDALYDRNGSTTH
jgi:hypothetical protein